MRRRFSSHMAMAQHGGSWGFMGHARLTPIQPSCGCHQHWPAATIFQDLPSLEHDTVGRMWHVHFTMAVHTVVALHHPDWILSNYLFVSKKWNKSWENLHISLQTSKMLVWHPTIHWKQIPRRPSEKKKNTRSQAVLARRSAIGSISAALAREHLESFGGRSCNEAMAGHIVTRLGLPWIFADFAVYPVIFRFCVIKQGLVYQVYHMIFPRFRQINGKLRGTMW